MTETPDIYHEAFYHSANMDISLTLVAVTN
jgi:hypothetical protein